MLGPTLCHQAVNVTQRVASFTEKVSFRKTASAELNSVLCDLAGEGWFAALTTLGAAWVSVLRVLRAAAALAAPDPQ